MGCSASTSQGHLPPNFKEAPPTTVPIEDGGGQEVYSPAKSNLPRTRIPPVKVGNSEICQQDVHDLVLEKIQEHLPGTRNWIFDDVKSWASTGTERLFWLMAHTYTHTHTHTGRCWDR